MTIDPSPLQSMGIQSRETMDIAAAEAALRSNQASADSAGNLLDRSAGLAHGVASVIGGGSEVGPVASAGSTVAERLRGRAIKATGTAASYAVDEPIKALLLAAATGALLMGIAVMTTRWRA